MMIDDAKRSRRRWVRSYPFTNLRKIGKGWQNILKKFFNSRKDGSLPWRISWIHYKMFFG